MTAEAWDSSDAYEQYVGRWSRKVAVEFLRWLAPAPGLEWADVGCGTGALSSVVLDTCAPAAVHGIDSSESFVAQARRRVPDPRARFETGDAARLDWPSGVCDVTVSGLVLNFVRDHDAATREMVRVTRPGRCVAAYVWDYAGGMQMMRHFWEAAIAVSPHDARLDQAERFPLCQPEPLRALFEGAGLTSVTVRAIDIPTVFQDFDDYWNPFLGRTGAAPTYLAAVSDDVRERIRLHLKSRLAPPHGSAIELTARAWAVLGVAAAPGLHRSVTLDPAATGGIA
jgi:trans-aconitate methyltransferase